MTLVAGLRLGPYEIVAFRGVTGPVSTSATPTAVRRGR